MIDRILVVDDNLLARQMLASQLATLGYPDVCKAASGTEAMEQILSAHEKGDPFHIVMLDWRMPSMNGIDFLIKCRNDPRFAKTAIIMASAEREDRNIIEALEAGATCYLVKPYSLQSLEEKIKQAVQWLGSVEAGIKEVPK